MRKEIPIVSLLLVLSVPVFSMGADWKNFRADTNRMEKRIHELSAFGANREGGVSRVAFSDADVEGRKYIRSIMEKAGLKVRVDAAGNIISHSGKTIGEGIRFIGGDPDNLQSAKRNPSEILAYLELHIEQGGILEAEKINIGVVEGIVGINLWNVSVLGLANHAGTTPMDQRKDALLAAAKLVNSVNHIAKSIPGRQVATVGTIQAEPGAPNVIPGKVVMSLEIRDLEKSKIDLVFEKVKKSAEKIAADTGTTISFAALDVTAVPAPTDQRLRKLIQEAATGLGLTTKLMPSGAGHDAQDLARIVPIGMIFVPSVGGISHSPKEFTTPPDVANGASVLMQAILEVDEKGL